MDSTTKLLEQLYTAKDLYRQIDNCCNDDKCYLYTGTEPKVPQPEIAKWRMQRFGDEECKKLAEGTLELSRYKWPSFHSRHILSKPTYWHVTTFIMIALGVLAILFFTLFLTTNATIANGNEQVNLAKAEYTAIDNLFSDDNYLTWRALWNSFPTTEQLENGWNSVENSWSAKGYNVSVDTLDEIFQQSKQSNGNITLSTFEYNLRQFLRDNQTTFDKDMVYLRNGISVDELQLSPEFRDNTRSARSAYLTLFILFLVLMLICEIIRFIRKESVLSFIEDRKTYSRELAFRKEEEAEFNKNCHALQEQYDSEAKTEPARYKKSYDEYIQKLNAYEAERDKHNKNISKNIQRNIGKIHKIADELSYLDMLPAKYTYTASNIQIKAGTGTEVDELCDFYHDEVEPLEDEINGIIDILESGRADTYKEALNCYISDCAEQKRQAEANEHMRRMEYEARQSAEEQARLQQAQIKATREAGAAQAKAVIDSQIAALRAQIKVAQSDARAGKITNGHKAEIISALEREITKLENKKKWDY